MRVVLLFFISLNFILILKPASAKSVELKFGPEFTFGVNNNGHIIKYCQHLREHLVRNQPEGAQFKYEFTVWPEDKRITGCSFYSPEGWSFKAKSDPGVIEVTMSPMTVEQFKKFKSNIQDAIFVSANNLGYFAELYTGGGHINIGTKEFEGRGTLFRNFIMDFFNHNEIGLGVMNYDTNNALSLSLLSSDDVDDVIHEFNFYDKYHMNHNQLLMNEIDKALSRSDDEFWWPWQRPLPEQMTTYERMGYQHEIEGRPSKFFALGFTHSNKPEQTRRIEVRSVRAQPDLDTFIRQIELFQKRVDFLANNRSRISFKPQVAIAEPLNPSGVHKLTPPIDPQDALKAFYTYVTQSGLAWSDHRSYLWPQWLSVGGELETFEKSDWYLINEKKFLESKKSQTRNRNCEGLLSS